MLLILLQIHHLKLAQHQHGALMIIVNQSNSSTVETGEIIDAKLRKNLLRSNFLSKINRYMMVP